MNRHRRKFIRLLKVFKVRYQPFVPFFLLGITISFIVLNLFSHPSISLPSSAVSNSMTQLNSGTSVTYLYSDTAPVPTLTLSPPPNISIFPKISARHVFIEDLDSGEVLFHQAADDRIYPASTAKIMTALVVLDSFHLDQIIEVKDSFLEGRHIGFQAGEKITVEKLLYALLIQSGNDAAEILAQNYCANSVCGRSAFVQAMNNKVQEFGLQNTHFSNPTGLDEEDNYSSASDLARIAKVALKNSLLARIVSTENAVISSSDDSLTHILTNTNELLGRIPGVLGVKTGFTDKAGGSLITVINRSNRRILVVVLGSASRFEDTEKIISWVFPEM